MKLSAVLLAGGESRRFGSDKAIMSFRGTPMWKRQIQLLQSLAPAELLVSARTDPAWRPSDARFVADRPPFHGPLSGLVAAMAAMRGTHLLALAVDMPLMPRSCLQQMCDLISLGRGVVPYTGLRAEPLAAIYPRESFPHLLKALELGELTLQTVAAKLVASGMLLTIDVSPAEQEFYRSINEPTDLASATAAAAAYLPQVNSNFFIRKTFNK
ncbi:MAG: molybdenum cofactor guanylyltransferase [Chthoniobacterales bacterium]